MNFTVQVKMYFYFTGWSHKCFKSISVGHKAAESIELTPAVLFKQVKLFEHLCIFLNM